MNIGILGAGNIAATMATTLQSLKNVTCYAVAVDEVKNHQQQNERSSDEDDEDNRDKIFSAF